MSLGYSSLSVQHRFIQLLTWKDATVWHGGLIDCQKSKLLGPTFCAYLAYLFVSVAVPLFVMFLVIGILFSFSDFSRPNSEATKPGDGWNLTHQHGIGLGCIITVYCYSIVIILDNTRVVFHTYGEILGNSLVYHKKILFFPRQIPGYRRRILEK